MAKASKGATGGAKKKDYRIVKKRSGRFAVLGPKGYVNGIDKAKILVAEGLVKTGLPKPKEEAATPAQ